MNGTFWVSVGLLRETPQPEAYVASAERKGEERARME